MDKLYANRSVNLNSPAVEGLALVLADCFEEMYSQVRFADFDRSLEERRQLRVLVRRLSFSLEHFGPYLDPDLVVVQNEVDRIMDALGKVIDEAAFIKALVKSQHGAPNEYLAGIDLLIDERRSCLHQVTVNLSAMVAENSLVELRRRFQSSLEAATQKPATAVLSFADVSRQTIAACLREMEAGIVTIYRPSKTRSSHRLRISVRKLQEALELFSHFHGAHLSDFANELAPLQEKLGKLRNLDQNINALGDWLTAHRANAVSAEALSPEWKAAVWLLGEFFQRRPKRFRRALEAEQRLLSDALAQRLRQWLIESEPRARRESIALRTEVKTFDPSALSQHSA